MIIMRGTKANIVGREKQLEVAFNQNADIGDYVMLTDGWEYELKEVYDGEITVVA